MVKASNSEISSKSDYFSLSEYTKASAINEGFIAHNIWDNLHASTKVNIEPLELLKTNTLYSGAAKINEIIGLTETGIKAATESFKVIANPLYDNFSNIKISENISLEIDNDSLLGKCVISDSIKNKDSSYINYYSGSTRSADKIDDKGKIQFKNKDEKL